MAANKEHSTLYGRLASRSPLPDSQNGCHSHRPFWAMSTAQSVNFRLLRKGHLRLKKPVAMYVTKSTLHCAFGNVLCDWKRTN